MKLPFIPFRGPKAEDARQEPKLELYRDPFQDDGPCNMALAVPDSLRQAVTEACPRCGAVAAGGPGSDCLLARLDLDIKGLDEEAASQALRGTIGRLEPRLL